MDYPSEALASCLDCVNVAAFGLRLPGTGANVTTDFDAPLYDLASHFSASYGVVSWIDVGGQGGNGHPALRSLLVPTQQGQRRCQRALRRCGAQAAREQHHWVISYDEVQRLVAASSTAGRRAATTAYDNASVGDVWVAFDDAAVVAEKLAFSTRRGLLGYFLSSSIRRQPYGVKNRSVSARVTPISTSLFSCPVAY
jgi:chitinase